MINKKSLFAVSAIFAITANANAQPIVAAPSGVVVESRTEVISDIDATGYSPSDGEIRYDDKNLANYQDPYLINPRGYKNNQYGQAAPAPKQNVFIDEYYGNNARIRYLEPSNGVVTERIYIEN